jgi:predicted outer membrane protein
MHRMMIAALPFMLTVWPGAASAQVGASPKESPAAGPTDEAAKSSGPLDREEQHEQSQGLGPEGTDLGSPGTKVKPTTTPPGGIRNVDEVQFSVKQILVGARRVNELDVQAAKLAQTRAQSRAVKRLAADTIREDQATMGRLMSYARMHDVELGPAAAAARSVTAGHDKPVPASAAPDVAQPGSESGAADVSNGPFAQPARTLEEQVRELEIARGSVVDTQFARLQVEANAQTLASIVTVNASANDPDLKLALDTWRASVKKRMNAAKALDTSKR